MRIILEEATKAGWACFTQPCEYEPNKLVSVGGTAAEALAASGITGTVAPYATNDLNEWAQMITVCDPHSDSPRKINMIKLLRSITGCGLKEAKDAIEGALR